MTPERARQVLLLHRPGVDEADAEVQAALALVARDAAMREWLAAQQEAHAAVRREFRGVNPPAALKEQILSERPWHTRPVKARHLLLAMAACLVVAALGSWWTHRSPREDKSFAAFRARMVSTALREYGMELETNRMDAIRAYFQQRAMPADFALPAGLARAESTGCLAVSWQSHRVAMVCFKTGQPLSPGRASDLWFFVIENRGVSDAPQSAAPQFATVNSAATVTWSSGGKIYLLAVAGTDELLRKFL